MKSFIYVIISFINHIYNYLFFPLMDILFQLLQLEISLTFSVLFAISMDGNGLRSNLLGVSNDYFLNTLNKTLHCLESVQRSGK